MNEAEASMHVFRLSDAIHALEKAVAHQFAPAYSKLLRAKGWTDSWKDFEQISSNITNMYKNCIERSTEGVLASCEVESGVEYLDPTRESLIVTKHYHTIQHHTTPYVYVYVYLSYYVDPALPFLCPSE